MKTTLLLLSAVALASCSRINVQHVKSSELIKDEYYYVLPKTAMVFTIPVKTTTYKRGEHYLKLDQNTDKKIIDYCVEKFGLNKEVYLKLASAGSTVPPESELEDVVFSTAAKPDFNKIYKVVPTNRFLNTQTFSFTYTGDGIASESELSSENKTADLAFKTFDGLISIASLLRSSEALSSEESLTLPPALKKLDDYTNQYIAFKTSPAGAMDLDLYKEKLQNLEKLIAKYFAMVFYSEKTSTSNLQLVFCPDTPLKAEVRLFKLNGNTISINKDYQSQIEVSGIPAHSFDALTDDTCFRLTLTNENKGLGNHVTASGKGRSGYAYNLPATFKVTVKTNREKILLSQYIKLCQFGRVGSLSRKQSKASIQWNSETGELKKVTSESKALAAETISGAAGSVKGGVEFIQGDSETTRLEKEVKLLELKKKLQDLKPLVNE
jgi:hypothetical protein